MGGGALDNFTSKHDFGIQAPKIKLRMTAIAVCRLDRKKRGLALIWDSVMNEKNYRDDLHAIRGSTALESTKIVNLIKKSFSLEWELRRNFEARAARIQHDEPEFNPQAGQPQRERVNFTLPDKVEARKLILPEEDKEYSDWEKSLKRNH